MKKLSIIFIAGLFTLALYLNPVSAEAEVSSGTVPEAEMTVPAVTTAAPAKEKSDVNLTYVNLEEKERWILDEVLSDYVSEDVVELTDRGIRYSIGDWIDRDTHTYLFFTKELPRAPYIRLPAMRKPPMEAMYILSFHLRKSLANSRLTWNRQSIWKFRRF